MSVKLIGTTGSTCSRAALLTAAELGIKLELVNVDMSSGAHKKPDHLKLQPFGKVPILVDDDGTTIYESRAICRYLVLKYGKGSSLFQVTDLKQYGLVEQWISIESANFYPSISGIVSEAYFKPVLYGQTLNQQALDMHRAAIKPTLEVYEERLKTHKFLCGDKMTLPDIFHVPMAFYAFKAGNGDLFDGYPRVKKWIEGLFNYDKFKEVLAA